MVVYVLSLDMKLPRHYDVEMKTREKWIIIVLFIALSTLIYSIIIASLHRDVITAVYDLWRFPWFQSTIIDFYINQLLIFLWIAYKETNIAFLFVLLVLCIGFGSIISLTYFIYQLFKHKNLQDALCFTKRAP